MKKVFLVLLILLIAYVVVGALMPSEWEVTRRGIVKAPKAQVHAALVDLKKWNDWSVWNDRRDAKLKNDYDGAGKGAKWNWVSEGELGTGSMELTDVTADKISFTLKMVKPSEMEMSGTIELKDKNGETEVTWIDGGDVGNGGFFLGRYLNAFGMLDSMMGGEKEKALAGLNDFLQGGGVNAVNAHMKKSSK